MKNGALFTCLASLAMVIAAGDFIWMGSARQSKVKLPPNHEMTSLGVQLRVEEPRRETKAPAYARSSPKPKRAAPVAAPPTLADPPAELTLDEAARTWSSESVDSDWTETMLGYLTSALDAADGGSVAIRKLECHRTICRVVAEPGTQLALLTRVQELLRGDGTQLALGLSHGDGGVLTATAFVAPSWRR